MRLLSLDAFRGLTIAGMLLVNNIALDSRTPAQLTHAPWNGGVRFADVIFPWFLLIVGVAVSYSAASAKKKELSFWRVDLKILGRVLALVFLGCLIDSSLAKRPVFDLNVLQLIGLAYGVASIVGHVKPIFLLGRGGGKGVATAGGVFAALVPIPLAIAFAVFALVLLASGYVSLGSLAAAATLPLAIALVHGVRAPAFAVSILVAAFVFWSHRANIGRLRRGEESRFRRRGGTA